MKNKRRIRKVVNPETLVRKSPRQTGGNGLKYRQLKLKEKTVNKCFDEKSGKSKDSKPFLSCFVGKNVLIRLMNRDELIGVLFSNNYNKYDVLLKQGSRLYLVPKHAIAYIQLREPVQRR